MLHRKNLMRDADILKSAAAPFMKLNGNTGFSFAH